jgi:hypothetical protein
MRQCAGTKAETIGLGELGVLGAALGFSRRWPAAGAHVAGFILKTE